MRRRGEPEVLASCLTTVAENRPPTVAENDDRSTRQDNDLYVPRFYNNMGERRFSCRAPALYNTLPPELVRLPIPVFGRHLRRHLTNVSAAPD